MSTTNVLCETLENFSSISLEELNSSASFLDRINTKYLVHAHQLPDIIHHLKQHFSVLNIKDKTVFSYDNIYLDTKEYLFYQQHESWSSSRTKVRTRHYLDADNLAFFEYKHKAGDIQRKHRFQCPVAEHGKLTPSGMKFYHELWQDIYPHKEVQYIFPSMWTRYKRFTLCSHNMKERLTIDFAIELIELRGENKWAIKILDGVAIVESKSMSHDCLSHRVMEQQWIPKAKACSKYGLGIYYHNHAETRKKFQHTLDTIDFINTCGGYAEHEHLLLNNVEMPVNAS